ncbi:hypothetical protein GCM10009416_33990 [Craurococcus roseus]|uniref:Uncharacterized protein n=1 Tax=Craurococcus roseus TaxID=77585 RepID=A0ABN1FKJ6_9PROT
MDTHGHEAATPATGWHPGGAKGGYGDLIARALSTEGGHLAIGRGGFTLHFGPGAWMSGHDSDVAKRACADAGLPVIDSRRAPLDRVVELAIKGPMVAVGHPPCPGPHHALSYVPLALVAERYLAAGAEVLNRPSS